MAFNDLPPRAIPRPFPRPKRVIATVAAYALALGFGVALFSGSIPGLGGHVSTYTQIDGREYYTDAVYVPSPGLGQNRTAPSTVEFHNVTFWFWVTDWGTWAKTLLHGNGTEINGTTYGFGIGNPSLNASRSDFFLSPDLRWAAGWSGGWFLSLYVAVAPSSGPSSGSN